MAQLNSPVAITAGTTYVVSYHTSSGYTVSRPYFTSAYDNPPLRALRDGEDGPNGVYLYDSVAGTLPAFPSMTYEASNYWVDVVFEPEGQPTVLTATVTVLARPYDGSTAATITGCTLAGVVEGEDVTCVYSGATAAFATAAAGTSKAVSATGLTLGGADKDNYSFAGTGTGTGTINKATLTVTPATKSITHGAPVPAPSFYTFAVSGFVNGESAAAADGYIAPSCTSDYATTTPASPPNLAISCSGGSATNYTFDTTATAALAVQATIWGDSTPGPDSSTNLYNSTDTQSVELGTRFRSSLDGQITALRFWKDAGNNSAHVGHLWSNTGTLLATAAFTNETASGWQTAQLEHPGRDHEGHELRRLVPHGHLPQDRVLLPDQWITATRRLTALQSGVETGVPAPNGNGLYAYGSSATFPVNTYMATNYWADVVFEAAPNDGPGRGRRQLHDERGHEPRPRRDGRWPHDSPVDNDTDADGDVLTVTAVDNATGGTVSLVAGTITFVPTANLCEPGDYGFDYTVSDGELTDTGHADVTITCVNDPPVAADDAASRRRGLGSRYPVDVLLANDSFAPDAGETLAVDRVGTASHGATALVLGEVRYTPTADFFGTSTPSPTPSPTATAHTDTAVGHDRPGLRQRPAGRGERHRHRRRGLGRQPDRRPGQRLLRPGCGRDPHGRPRRLQPANGTVALVRRRGPLHAERQLLRHADSFTYTVTDGNGATATASVDVTVTCVNDPPVAADDTATVAEDSAANPVDVLANDSFAPDAGETLTVDRVDSARQRHGRPRPAARSATRRTPTSSAPTPSPTPSPTATAAPPPPRSTVTVTAVNDPPVAADDTATVAEDSAANAIDVLANDTDIDGGATTVTAVTQPANGTVAITGGGAGLTYKPNANYCNGGTPVDTFTYTLTPGGSTATVSVTVTCVDDAPVVVLSGDFSDVNEGESRSFTYTVTDIDSTPVVTESCGDNATLTDTPAANQFTCTFPDGPATTTVNVTANNGPVSGDDPHTITIDNVAPTATLAGEASVDEGATYSLSLGETDPGRDTVTAFVVDWGDGSSNTYTSGGAKTHVYADGTSTPDYQRRPGRRGRHLSRLRHQDHPGQQRRPDGHPRRRQHVHVGRVEDRRADLRVQHDRPSRQPRPAQDDDRLRDGRRLRRRLR